jgi:LAS superfamily LD-carboxypeptidase LdcB
MYRALSAIGLFSLIFNACTAFVKDGGLDPNVITQRSQNILLTADVQPKSIQAVVISKKVYSAFVTEKIDKIIATEVQALDKDGFLLSDINQFPVTKEYLDNLEKSGELVNIAANYPQLRLVNRERTQANKACLPDLANMISDYEKETGATDATIISAYRGWYEQEIAWAQVKDKSKVTLPGSTEHHIGCTFDFGTSGRNFIGKNEGFYKWMTANASKYGFAQPYTVVIQLPNQTIAIEEWHWRWVGKEVAAIWQASQMSENPESLASILAKVKQVQRDGSSINVIPQ